MSKESNELTLRQHQGVTALLTCGSIAESARQAAIGERTLRRWLREPAFQSQLHQAQRQAFSSATKRIQRVAQGAVEALRAVMGDEKASATSRVRAAQTILRYAARVPKSRTSKERPRGLERAKKASGSRCSGGPPHGSTPGCSSDPPSGAEER